MLKEDETDAAAMVGLASTLIKNLVECVGLRFIACLQVDELPKGKTA